MKSRLVIIACAGYTFWQLFLRRLYSCQWYQVLWQSFTLSIVTFTEINKMSRLFGKQEYFPHLQLFIVLHVAQLIRLLNGIYQVLYNRMIQQWVSWKGMCAVNHLIYTIISSHNNPGHGIEIISQLCTVCTLITDYVNITSWLEP